MSRYKFNELNCAPLIIDAIYESKGTLFGDDPLSKLLPKSSNQGGFRPIKRLDASGLPAYIVLYTSFEEVEWPDSLNTETGILKYYGDNRTPGKSLHDTPKKGNMYLKDIYSLIDSPEGRKDIPPFLVFQKTGRLFDVRFLGVAVPGNPNISSDKELNAIWRTKDGNRFQNYEAYFTIIDTGFEEISKDWLVELINDHGSSIQSAPNAWRRFIDIGRRGVNPLVAPKQQVIPKKEDQLPKSIRDRKLLQILRDNYSDNPTGFEKCATKIIQMMDSNFEIFELTRPWRDGGRDAIGKYKIGVNYNPLMVECALEAKCYAENSAVGVRPMSRLISRIKYRQFGIMVTTSYLNSQVYNEIIEDGHPILVINGKDIVNILKSRSISMDNIRQLLKEIDQNDGY